MISRRTSGIARELRETTCRGGAEAKLTTWLERWGARLGWSRASLFVKSADHGDLILAAAYGPPPLKTVWEADHPFMRWLSESGQPVSAREAACNERRGLAREAALRYFVEVGATLCIPLVWNDFAGILNISTAEGEWRMRWPGTLDSLRLAAAALAGDRRLAEQADRLRRELTLWDCTRRQFLSRMTDELKTPLNSVIGLADALASGLDGQVTDEQAQHLAMIRASGEELLGLVNRLLDLGTLEAEALTLHPRKVSLERLVKDLVGGLEFQRGLPAWRVVMEPELPGIYVDEEKVGRVLATLMATDGPAEPASPRQLKARRRGDMVELTIQGYGAPVPLDLVVVQRIVELHGGSFWPDGSLSGTPAVTLTFPTKPIGL